MAPFVAPGDEVDTILTTRGYLSRGISFATTVYGGDGNDEFLVYSNQALLKLFGEAGNDTFIVRAFLLGEVVDGVLQPIPAGSSSVAETFMNGGDGDDYFEYNINAPVSIDGGPGFNTVVVVGTEGPDNFVITRDGVRAPA
jgi:hypothetical protein